MPTEKENKSGLRYVRAITVLVSILVIANLAIEATLLLRY
jgi:hypothetical protein